MIDRLRSVPVWLYAVAGAVVLLLLIPAFAARQTPQPPAAPVAVPTTPAPTTARPTATPTPTVSSPAPVSTTVRPTSTSRGVRGAVDPTRPDSVARAFVTAYSNPRAGQAKWLEAMRPYGVRELLDGLAYTELGNVPQGTVTDVRVRNLGRDASAVVVVTGGRLLTTYAVAMHSDDRGAWKVWSIAPADRR